MTNINFIITKPSTGYDIVDANVMSPSTTISQFDSTNLNIALDGFGGAINLSLDLVLPDGSEIRNLLLSATIENNHLFSLNLSEDILKGLTVGVENELIISQIRIENLGFAYKTTKPYSVRLFRTDTEVGYTPTDIENLFIIVNKLQEEILRLKNQ